MNSPVASHKQILFRRNVVSGLRLPKALLLYAYYAFIFTLPLQVIDIGISEFGVSKLFGLALIAIALTRPKLCFSRPPKAFYFFAAYLAVCTFLGLLFMADPQTTGVVPQIVSQLFTQIQLLILFVIGYNLLRSHRVMNVTLLMMALSCIFMAIAVVAAGAQATVEHSTRESVFGENPNETATVFSLGLLALVGLAYGQKNTAKKFRILSWITGPLLLLAVVRTGSRGGLLALILALFALVIKPHNLRQNLKAGFIVLIAVVSLAWVSYQIDFVRERWEDTYEKKDIAGRDEIFGAAWDMFLERPLIGWGPINHLSVLGSRLGLPFRDPHSTYLWVLNETGLLGAIPFFAGLWFCWRSAWRARKGQQAVVPVAMLGCLLLVNFKGSGHMDKFFWVTLAYVVAAGSQVKAFRSLYRNRSFHAAAVGQRTPFQLS